MGPGEVALRGQGKAAGVPGRHAALVDRSSLIHGGSRPDVSRSSDLGLARRQPDPSENVTGSCLVLLTNLQFFGDFVSYLLHRCDIAATVADSLEPTIN